MRSTILLSLAILLSLTLTSSTFARIYDESLKVEVDYKNNYKAYNYPFPSLIDVNMTMAIEFYEDSSGVKNNQPFKNQSGLMFVADQNNLTDLTTTSPLALLGTPDFNQYTSSPLNTDGNAVWSTTTQSPAQLAVFFVFPIVNGGVTVFYLTQIFYTEIVDYHADHESWTPGPGWDGQTPFVFTSVTRRFLEFNGGPDNGGTMRGSESWGMDVLQATKPRNRSGLYILLPDASVKKLFPLPSHASIVDDSINVGAAIEPNISLNGNWVMFTYFHDVVNNMTSQNSGALPLKGADLYAIKIKDLVRNPSLDPSTLPVRRLTQTLLNGSQTAQDVVDKNTEAMNPTLAMGDFSFTYLYGRIFMHAIEIKTDRGKRLVFVSNMRRVGNSNSPMDKSNYNVNLFEAEHNFNAGTLKNIRQIHYYTTTSALSPANMRDGFSFAYQSTTEEGRSWEVQVSKSNYKWSPGVGYGINGSEALHLQTSCVTPATCWLVTCFYYNANNNGFGTIVANPENLLGKNVEVYGGGDYTFGSSWGMLPRQAGIYNIILGGSAGDYPGYSGKLTTPRAGRPNQLYAAYSPYTSNSKSTDNDGNKARYDSYIVNFPDVDNRLNSSTPWDVSELQPVLSDNSKFKSQVWPAPVLSHRQRFGEPPQVSSLEKAVDKIAYYQNNPDAIHGKPYGVIGTSSLSHTDGITKDWRLAVKGKKYNLDTLSNNEKVNIQNNIMGLSRVMLNNGIPDIYERVQHEDILGISIDLTSNKPDQYYNMGYQTAGGTQETVKRLGVYDVRTAADDSFLATIPSDQAIALHLLDSDTGLKLLDQRSWKSLKAGEVRNDCGGCHNHVDAPVPFAGTVADGASYQPLDMVTKTHYIEYDAFCNPMVLESSSPTLRIPEYYADILPELQTYCTPCHANSGSAAGIFNLDNPGQAYNNFKDYYNNDGALGSPLFWAAYGGRTDNRDNTDPFYQNSKFKYSLVHNALGLCNGDETTANFVYQFGLWIDHLMPKDTQSNPPYNPDWDRFHPSVNFDLALINGDPTMKDTTALVVSYWDDTDFSGGGTLEVYVNGTPLPINNTISSNGSMTIDISGLNLQDLDVIEAVAIDFVDNRQRYRKTYGELLAVSDPAPMVRPVGAKKKVPGIVR